MATATTFAMNLVMPYYDNAQETTCIRPAVSKIRYICRYSTDVAAAMEKRLLSVKLALL